MRSSILRQAGVAIAVAAAAAVAAVLVPSLAGRAQVPGLPLYMQIVAHEDDDFLFMNPDVANLIASYNASVTVYITAGQSNGTAPDATPVLTREQFARARQLGELAAYAQMAGNLPNAWTRTLSTPDGVHEVETYALNAAPWIQLVFMNLPDGGDTVEPNTYALSDMWEDPAYLVGTIVPECLSGERCSWLRQESQPYDRAGVISVLQALIASYQPVHVRTLDPQNFQSEAVQFDNLDHVATARFADAALASYHGPYGTGRNTVTYYKGYSFFDYPENLGIADYDEKRATAEIYRPYDPNYELYAAAYEVYYYRQWERYPASTTWLERANDGRLVAVSVQDRQVRSWHESTPGGDWIGPVLLASETPLASHLTLLKRPDGLLQIFALRLPLERQHFYPPGVPPGAPPQEVVTAVQVASPGAIHFGPWSVVGSPDGACSTCQHAGVQTAAIDVTGRTFVFAKNSQGRVSYAWSSGGPWSAWTTFVVEDIIDGIAAITRDDGRVEAFAASRSGRIQHYIQQGTTDVIAHDSIFQLLFGGAASAPTVTKNQDGRPEIFYREAGSGRVLTVYETVSGSWAGPVVLYGDAGLGPVAAIRRGGAGHIMLFERNVWAGISATWQQAPNSAFYLQWALLGGYLNEYPSAATDDFGRVVVAVKGADGRLYMRRESSAGSFSFADWVPIDGPCSDGAYGGDSDFDGHCGDVDNCPNVPNPSQQDLDANGVGNVCECGDVDLTNVVDLADVALLREHIAQIPPGLTPIGVDRCSVIGLAADCDVRDVTILRRSTTPGLAWIVSPVCAAANP